MLYTDKEEIKLQYHSQLNELMSQVRKAIVFNLLNAELNPIRHLLASVGARHIVHISRIMVNIVIKKNTDMLLLSNPMKEKFHVSVI